MWDVKIILFLLLRRIDVLNQIGVLFACRLVSKKETEMAFKSYSEAAAQLPSGAKWSSSFGYPGEGGYCEYHRTAEGTRFVIENGSWSAIAPFTWTLREAS